MNSKCNEQHNKTLEAYNYCVAFIDLLGQRDALQDQGLLPVFKSKEEEQAFILTLKKSIGSIASLQEQAETMLDPILAGNKESPIRSMLPKEQHAQWDDLNRTKITTQRWSDGLVSYACLGDTDIKCHTNNVFGIFGLAGVLCLIGLANKRPVRGAIEISWGVELHHNELYGPAVARAYELESEIAQYPRIVVGKDTVTFLNTHASNCEQNIFSQLDGELAKKCLNMLLQDFDGHYFLNYLGEEFQLSITGSQHTYLYDKAKEFVNDQWNIHKQAQRSKLAFRYVHLLQYFDAHPPKTS
jgi:hypothetical protein